MSFTRSNLFRQILPAAFIAVLAASCSSEPQSPLAKYGPVVESVIRTENGAFRGINLGDNMDSVLAKEAQPASEADDGYLYYEFKQDSNSYNVSYNFDENGLTEIQSDIYLNNPGSTEQVFNSFKSYFDTHFGASESHQGFTVWSVKSDKFGDVKINLSDESAELTVPNSPGKIAIWIYPNQE